MKTLVCFKIVPNWDKVLEDDWENFSTKTDVTYAGMGYNCFDESALEYGLRITEKLVAQGSDSFCAAITVGNVLPEAFVQGLYAVGYTK